MIHFDTISLAISVGLGLLSIGLAGFAIWLSLRFEERSSRALESIREVSQNIRATTEVSLTHQKDFSAKMLDSILDQNQYGGVNNKAISPDENQLEDLIKAKLKSTEASISEKVAEQIRALQSSQKGDPEKTQQTIEAIQNEIARLSEMAQETSSQAILPITLRNRLSNLMEFPAHYSLLDAIIRSGATDIESLDEVQSKYHVPEDVKDGIKNLIEEGILVGDFSEFKIPDDALEHIRAWTSKNRSNLNALAKQHATKSEVGVTEGEREIAKTFSF